MGYFLASKLASKYAKNRGATYDVLDHLPEEHRTEVKRKLDRLHLALTHLNPGAARTLEQRMEETLTIHRLHTPQHMNTTARAFSLAFRSCSHCASF